MSGVIAWNVSHSIATNGGALQELSAIPDPRHWWAHHLCWRSVSFAIAVIFGTVIRANTGCLFRRRTSNRLIVIVHNRRIIGWVRRKRCHCVHWIRRMTHLSGWRTTHRIVFNAKGMLCWSWSWSGSLCLCLCLRVSARRKVERLCQWTGLAVIDGRLHRLWVYIADNTKC